MLLRVFAFVAIASVAGPAIAQSNVTPRGVATNGVERTGETCRQTVLVPDPMRTSGLLGLSLAFDSSQPDVVRLTTVVRYAEPLLEIAPFLNVQAPNAVDSILAEPGVGQSLALPGGAREYKFIGSVYEEKQGGAEYFEVQLPLADASAFLSSANVASRLSAGRYYADFVYSNPFLSELAIGFGVECLERVDTERSPDEPMVEAELSIYRVESFPSGSERLVATMSGREYLVVEVSEPYEILTAHLADDFDGDGIDDVLYSIFPGGNCCPPEYFIASIYPDGTTREAEAIALWEPPLFEDGVFTANDPAGIVTYRYEAGRIEILDERRRPELVAVAEVRSTDDVLTVPVDIDLDGVNERLACDLLRALSCRLEDSRGEEITHLGLGCSRVGQLTSVTNGLTDFVCNEQIVMRWNGVSYE